MWLKVVAVYSSIVASVKVMDRFGGSELEGHPPHTAPPSSNEHVHAWLQRLANDI